MAFFKKKSTAAEERPMDLDEIMKKYDDLQMKFELYGGYERGYAMEKVANGLGLDASIRSR